MIRLRRSLMLVALAALCIPFSVPSTISPAAAAPAAGGVTSLDTVWSRMPSQTLGRYAPSRGVGEQFSTPAVGDLDRNGSVEIVTGSVDGRIYIYDAASGSMIRRFDVSNVPGVVVSSPALVDLTGDGRLDIVVGFMPANDLASQVSALTPTVAAFTANGTRLWGVRTCHADANHHCNVFASPVIADIDGDGLPEVVITSQDEKLHVLRGRDGSPLPGFPFSLLDTSWSTPAVADMNGDGKPEIVVASDAAKVVCNHYPSLGCTYGTVVRIIDRQGRELRRTVLNGEIPQSSPVIGHIQGAGSTPQIVLGAGNTFFNSHGRSGGYPLSTTAARRLYGLSNTLQPLPGWSTGPLLDAPNIAVPALADVDGNGLDTVFAISTTGRLSAFRGDGSRRWGPVCVRDSTSGCKADELTVGRSSPVVADVDDDGNLEVIAITERTVRIYDAATGVEHASSGRLNPAPGAFAFAATPTIAAIDGQTNVFVHGLVDANSSKKRDAGDKDLMVRLTTGTPLGDVPWATFHGDTRHSGSTPAHAPQPPRGCADTDAGRYVRWLRVRLLGTQPSGPDYVTGCTTQSRYPGAAGRKRVARDSVNSRAWVTIVVQRLYQNILGRPGEQGGVTFWTNQILNGKRQRDVAISMYGSSEQYRNWGGTSTNARPYVTKLYTHVLGRDPDAGGLTYWSAKAVVNPAAAARQFYQSPESRRLRVTEQYGQLLCRLPDAGGRQYWANRLVKEDDLALTFELVSSDEFLRGARRGSCPA